MNSYLIELQETRRHTIAISAHNRADAEQLAIQGMGYTEHETQPELSVIRPSPPEE